MGIRYEWGNSGTGVQVVPAAEYEAFGLYPEDEDPDPDSFALVIGGESGGGFVIEDTLPNLLDFANRLQAEVAGVMTAVTSKAVKS